MPADNRKTYFCIKCKRKIESNPKRVVIQFQKTKPYRQFTQVDRFELCEVCFSILKKWVETQK